MKVEPSMDRIMPAFRPPRICMIDDMNLLRKVEEVKIITKDLETRHVKELLSKFKRKKTFDEWIGGGEKIAFLMYLGKVPGILRSESGLPDLSNLLLFKELEDFAEENNVEFYVIFENSHFDREIYEFPRILNEKIETTRALLEMLGIKHIKFIDYINLTNELVPEYFEEFERLKREIKIGKEELKGQVLESFLFNYYSYPFNDMGEALNAYMSKDERIRGWALNTTRNYLAFLEARKKTNWWEKVVEAGFSRATISRKRGVISINPYIGRLSFAHGVAFITGGILSTEFFMDVVSRGKKVYRFCWKSIPMFYSLTR